MPAKTLAEHLYRRKTCPGQGAILWKGKQSFIPGILNGKRPLEKVMARAEGFFTGMKMTVGIISFDLL
jgi:hypothetical protein